MKDIVTMLAWGCMDRVGRLSAFLFFLGGILSCGATHASFSGSETFVYDLVSNPLASEVNKISLRFRTIQPRGLLFHAEGTQGDLVSIELVRGRIRLRFSSGISEGSQAAFEIVSGHGLANNLWHTVDVSHVIRHVTLHIDGIQAGELFLSDRFSRLNLDNQIAIAGSTSVSSPATHFEGCLEDPVMNKINIFDAIKLDSRQAHFLGNLHFSCEEVPFSPIHFSTPSSHVVFPTFIKKSFTFQAYIRSYLPEGLIVSKTLHHSTITVGLEEHRIVLRVSSCARPADAIVMRASRSDMGDGAWHHVEVRANSEKVSVQIDSKEFLLQANPWVGESCSQSDSAYIGGSGGGPQRKQVGFVGCMHEVQIDGTNVSFSLLSRNMIVGAVSGACQHEDMCFPNPCKNNGTCIRKMDGYLCDCSSVPFVGMNCENSLLREDCQQYRDIGLNESSYCLVGLQAADGASRTPHEVYCKVTEFGVTTVVNHNLAETNLSLSQSSSGRSSILLEYSASSDALTALVAASLRCRQHLRYHCYAAPINHHGYPASVAWSDRQGQLHEDWVGTACSCLRNQSCSAEHAGCNCDAGDYTWRSDSGFVTDKDSLPIASILYWTTRRVGSASVSVGALECEHAVSPHLDTTLAPLLGRVCRPEISVTHTQQTSLPPGSFYRPQIFQKEVFENTNGTKILVNVEKETGSSAPSDAFSILSTEAWRVSVLGNSSIQLNILDTSPLPRKEGLFLSMSLLTVIVVCVSSILLATLIGVTIVFCRRRSHRQRRRANDHDRASDSASIFVQFKADRTPKRPTITIEHQSGISGRSPRPVPPPEYSVPLTNPNAQPY